jgi:hypothetical protein
MLAVKLATRVIAALHEATCASARQLSPRFDVLLDWHWQRRQRERGAGVCLPRKIEFQGEELVVVFRRRHHGQCALQQVIDCSFAVTDLDPHAALDPFFFDPLVPAGNASEIDLEKEALTGSKCS